ncbi:TetR/AcrR family transcriptional regulator [Fictibacillus sp. 23RED33]|uniref:TetR/AcrR family transcriptional regulator n=1 Tax=Fictibacillus sp. 23RED33 TaxID=2745879 RepID=UPI0018CE90D6|nr:TetR family transcriptional regulator [Fictibacillus sp. 23RED33]MBH0175691.1 TetR/AcrR family transcriptional regulator [Fictibacillus sp. 23RED33]
MSREDKKTKILKAAELAYAEEGSNFSLRTVTKLAKVNVAAVNYYFQSKTNLLEIMAERIIGKLIQNQMENLEQLRRKETFTIQELVAAFVQPFFRFEEEEDEFESRSKLLGILLLDKSPEMREVFSLKTIEVDEQYQTTFQVLLPHLEADELEWRYKNMIGLIINNVSELLPLKELETLEMKEKNERVMKWIIQFATAGLIN